MCNGHIPHPHTFCPEEILKELCPVSMRTQDGLSLIVCHRSWVGLESVDIGAEHLQLWERPSHAVDIQDRQSGMCSHQQRLKAVDSPSFRTNETSDATVLRKTARVMYRTQTTREFP